MLYRQARRRKRPFALFHVKNKISKRELKVRNFKNFKKEAKRKYFIYWRGRKVLLTFVLDFVNGTYFIALLLATYLDYWSATRNCSPRI